MDAWRITPLPRSCAVHFTIPNLLPLYPNRLVCGMRKLMGILRNPWVLYEAFVATLEAVGVKDAAPKVFVPQIFVRT